MSEEKIINYKKENLTIIWKPDLCTHSAKCVKALPKVYNPKARPWIITDNATKEELIDQLKTCPSGALTFTLGE